MVGAPASQLCRPGDLERRTLAFVTDFPPGFRASRRVALSWVALATTSSCVRQPKPPDTRPTAARLVRAVNLVRAPIHLAVESTDDDDEWVDYVLHDAAEYLTAVETYLDLPFQQAARWAFGNDPAPWKVTLRGQRSVAAKGVAFAGVNEGRRIVVDYQVVGERNPSTLFHELGHYWFRARHSAAIDPESTAWFSEGIVTFLPLAMARDKVFPLSEREVRGIFGHWGRDLRSGEDIAIDRDFRFDTSTVRAFYQKAFQAQLIIAKELGPDYGSFARAAARTLPSANITVLAHLVRAKAIDWRARLSGWVFPGPYTVEPDELRDYLKKG